MSDALPGWIQLTHRDPRLPFDVRVDAIVGILPVSVNPTDGTKVFVNGFSESTADAGKTFVVIAETREEVLALLQAYDQSRERE